MKSIKSYSPRTRILLLLALLLAIIVSGLVVLYANRQSPNQESTSTSTSTTDTSAASNEDNDSPISDPRADQTGAGGIKTSEESGSAHAFPTTKPSLSVQIKNVEQSGDTLSVTAAVLPSAKGVCTVELSRSGSETISKSSDFNGSSCDVLSISVAQADTGSWDLTIKVIVDSNVATSTRSVTLH